MDDGVFARTIGGQLWTSDRTTAGTHQFTPSTTGMIPAVYTSASSVAR